MSDMKQFSIIKYENVKMVGDYNKYRFILEKEGRNKLVVLGVNPSVASDKESDRTMVKVIGFAERNMDDNNKPFDGFLMLNLYPQRATDPDALDNIRDERIHKENLIHIEDYIKRIENPTILLAFGNCIEKRDYLYTCFKEIVTIIEKYSPNWKNIGVTKQGNPKHLTRAGYCEFQNFDLNDYLNK